MVRFDYPNTEECVVTRVGRILLPDITIWVETVTVMVEVVGISVILLGIVQGFGEMLYGFVRHLQVPHRYELLRSRIGKALLLGLEILVAADVIKTVSIELTLQNLLILAVLIVIRTALGWTLFLDLESHLPWQKR